MKRGQRMRSVREHSYAKLPWRNDGLTQKNQHVQQNNESFEMLFRNASGLHQLQWYSFLVLQ